MNINASFRNENLTLPDVHPKKAFILGALEKEIRLSFATRIKGTVPEPYKELISEAKEKEQPVFKYDLESTCFRLPNGNLVIYLLCYRRTILQGSQGSPSCSGRQEGGCRSR
jgi:MIF4G like